VLITIVVMVSLKGDVIVQLPFDVLREGLGSSLAIKQLDADLNGRNCKTAAIFIRLSIHFFLYIYRAISNWKSGCC